MRSPNLWLAAVVAVSGCTDVVGSYDRSVVLAVIGDAEDGVASDGAYGLALWSGVEACVTITWDRRAVIDRTDSLQVAAVYVRSSQAIEDGDETPAEGLLSFASFGDVDPAAVTSGTLTATWAAPVGDPFVDVTFRTVADGCPAGVSETSATGDVLLQAEAW